jgi:hypothetical protein
VRDVIFEATSRIVSHGPPAAEPSQPAKAIERPHTNAATAILPLIQPTNETTHKSRTTMPKAEPLANTVLP